MFGFIAAFKRMNFVKGWFESPWAGLSNFSFLFASTDAYRMTRNTVLFNLVFIFSGLLVSVVIAIALNEVSKKSLSRIYQSAIVLPNLVSFVVVAYLVYALCSPTLGMLNKSIIPALGMDMVRWYNEPQMWVFILPIVNLWYYAGMGSVIYTATLSGISDELYEAARIDGATRWQMIKSITLPLLVPTMTVLTLLNLGNIFRGNFGLFYQVTMNASNLYPVTEVIDTYTYRVLTRLNDVGMATAAGLYQSVVGAVIICITNIFVRKIDPESALF
jgi:putative aldouronate transport system permease protein